MIDFYAVIREDSKYLGQDGGKPFPVSLSHSTDGYIWKGNGDRYRIADVILLAPSAGPVEASKPIPLVFDDEVLGADEAEANYQEDLKTSQWFSPILNQGFEIGFKFINRDGRRAPGAMRVIHGQ